MSDTETQSPASDITPAMPLLDDVKTKSRTIIRNIGTGSRPVSAEFGTGQEVEGWDSLFGFQRLKKNNTICVFFYIEHNVCILFILSIISEIHISLLKDNDRTFCFHFIN